MQIINPLVFYLIELLNDIDTILGIFIVIFISLLIILIIMYFSCYDFYDKDDDIIKSTKSWIKRSIIGLIITGLFVTVIPTKETMYQMLVANYVTYENVENASDIIKDSVDYIFEKLDKEEK